MIHITNKSDCCGCAACEQICPKNCISMTQDSEGFLYPTVDENACVNCGRCDSVCPIHNKREVHSLLKAFAFNLKDKEARYESASGGFFTAIATHVIKSGGVAFGVAFNSKMQAVTTFTEKENDIQKFRNSKYVQSIIGDSYKQVKNFLKQGRLVLFSGTPCQIQGLLNFLGKTYDNLLTMDLVCHGVPSPKVFDKYKAYLENYHKGKLTNYIFRTKRKGYNGKGYSCASAVFDDGSILKTEELGSNFRFMKEAFFAEICSRPVCHQCSFKDKERVSDFTVFDCWSVKKMAPQLSDGLGTSLLVVNSENGEQLIPQLEKYSLMKVVDLDRAILLDGLVMLHSVPAHPRRKEFFGDLDTLTIEQLMDKYLTPKGMTKIKIYVRDFLDHLGLLRYIRHIKYNLKK